MSSDARKPVFGVSDKVRHKPACAAAKKSLKAWNFGFRKKRNCTIRVVKTNALISCAVTDYIRKGGHSLILCFQCLKSEGRNQ